MQFDKQPCGNRLVHVGAGHGGKPAAQHWSGMETSAHVYPAITIAGQAIPSRRLSSLHSVLRRNVKQLKRGQARRG